MSVEDITADEWAGALKLNSYLANKLAPNRRDDLVSVGNWAIMKSVKSFDRSKGSFRRHAGYFIRRDQTRAFTNICKPFFVPHTIADYPEKANQIENVVVLDSIMEEQIPDGRYSQSAQENAANLATLESAMQTELSIKEAQLLKDYYIKGFTMEELAKKYGYPTRHESRNMVRRLIKRLQRYFESPTIAGYPSESISPLALT